MSGAKVLPQFIPASAIHWRKFLQIDTVQALLCPDCHRVRQSATCQTLELMRAQQFMQQGIPWLSGRVVAM